MTKSSQAQKLFIRLSTNQRKRGNSIPSGFRRRPFWDKKFPTPPRIRVEIVNAVTGEKTVAYTAEESKRSLKKWLRLRNMRAHFDSMVLKPNSSWFNFSSEEWKDFPIIVRIADAQFPYVITQIGEKLTFKNKITSSIYLRAADNIDYLDIVNQKKKLMKEWIEKHPVKTKKKAKRKKRMDYDFDD